MATSKPNTQSLTRWIKSLIVGFKFKIFWSQFCLLIFNSVQGGCKQSAFCYFRFPHFMELQPHEYERIMNIIRSDPDEHVLESVEEHFGESIFQSLSGFLLTNRYGGDGDVAFRKHKRGICSTV